ncbi:MAG: hypothetical protein FWE23_06030 [Chitinivibrionia bacterium]|nr:hypothetical protein [Chitinivibrionia bacterium]
MSVFKNISLADEEREFGTIDKWICSECAENTHWEQIVADNLEERNCDYCPESNKSASVNVLTGKILAEIKLKYMPCQETNVSPYPCGINVFDTHEVLSKLGYDMMEIPCGRDIIESIQGYNDIWAIKSLSV